MAETTIEWADYTFNPWVGCAKVSVACAHCYAESWAKRTGQPALWKGERRRTSVTNWNLPIRWERQAAAADIRPFVFCASLADVFEDSSLIHDRWRADLWLMIEATKHLTWLLLTKRPQNVARLVPPHWLAGQWPANAWLGCTVEDQARADERVPLLLQLPAPVRFLSCEPLLGLVDLTALRDGSWHDREGAERYNALSGSAWWSDGSPGLGGGPCIHWVIGGGESGARARQTQVEWAQYLRDSCVAFGAEFLWKQWGGWSAGTANTGRLLDGIEHNGRPMPLGEK
jgi:protein gp37